MKTLISVFVILFLLSFSPVFGQTGWDQNSGSYGTINSFHNYITDDVATQGSHSAVLGFTGTGEWNGLVNWFCVAGFDKNFTYATPIAILVDIGPLFVTGADSISVTFSATINGGTISVSKKFSGNESWQTLILEIPENMRYGNISNISIQVTTFGVSEGSVEVKLCFDNLRIQYDMQGNIVVIDSFGDLTDVSDPGTLPKEFSLAQNYPNPFNPTTVIKFSSYQVERITLKVYDVLGNEIATLVNEEKPAGEYKIIFDANLPSGAYFYKLEAGNRTFVKKMMLIK